MRFLHVSLALLSVFGGVSAATPQPCPALANIGHCSHGYWKNHAGPVTLSHVSMMHTLASDKSNGGGNPHPEPSQWPYIPGTCTQYSPSANKLSDIFPNEGAFNWGNPLFAPYKDLTLHEALEQKQHTYANIIRQGVATYFDSLIYPKSQSGFDTADVLAEFYEEMLAGGTGATLSWWAIFCHENGATCPEEAQIPADTQGEWAGVTCCPEGGIWNGVNCGAGFNPPGGRGDPQIGGFHGQSFQFHGLADEVFNLISTPTLQVNGHFAFLSSGKCDYNDTDCWTHPGTYIDQLGFSFGDHRVKLVAGPHTKGLHMEVNGQVVPQGNYQLQANGTDVSIKFNQQGQVAIKTQEFAFNIANSDMFFNMGAALLNRALLHLGAPRHTVTDRQLCHKEEHVDESKFQAAPGEHNHGAVEAAIEKKYGGVQVPLHGLIGQTWRNVVVCGKHWVGAVTDYVASDLFASDYFFNFFTKA